MRRKLNAIWRILTCKEYLLVTEEDSKDGPDILYDFTMPESDAKRAAGILFDIIDDKDQLLYEQEKVLRAFKKVLN